MCGCDDDCENGIDRTAFIATIIIMLVIIILAHYTGLV
jgi:hypothetical protein